MSDRADPRANPRANHRVAYFNGRIVPEREVVLPFRDRGFKYGDAAFDMTRTFHGRPFKLKEHIDRLYRSLRYLRIEPGLSPSEMAAASEEVLERNRHFLSPETDFWLGQRVSRGVDAVGDEGWEHTGPNVIVECIPLPLKNRARLFRDGIDIVVPPTRRVPPDSLSPRAKTHNYLNLITADLEAKSQDREAWSVLLDTNGHLAEGIGSNIFLVRGGEVMTPHERWVLPGVSRATVIALCGQLGIPRREADLDLYDAATADEIFMTSTSLCICPVRSIGGRPLKGSIPGSVTRRLTEAYANEVGCDFVAQYLTHLS
ncbi:MAG: aminotransferase class IV [Alphaproteobacteria bacterium]|nr:aminotransferase class IV [Alphaproteobacteria bacterium]